MIYVIGIFYAMSFWLIGSKWPKIPLLLIVALAPFQYDISTGGPVRFSIAEINLMLTIPLFFLRGRPVLFGPVAWPLAIYFGVCLVSAFVHWRATSLVSLTQMALYLIVAVIVFTSF